MSRTGVYFIELAWYRLEVYNRIVTAGGGNVVRYYKTMESLAAKLPGPREITHVFLDPGPKVIKLAELESLFESRAAASSTDQYSPLLTEESSYLMLVCRSLSKFIGLIASLLMALTWPSVRIDLKK